MAESTGAESYSRFREIVVNSQFQDDIEIAKWVLFGVADVTPEIVNAKTIENLDTPTMLSATQTNFDELTGEIISLTTDLESDTDVLMGTPDDVKDGYAFAELQDLLHSLVEQSTNESRIILYVFELSTYIGFDEAGDIVKTIDPADGSAQFLAVFGYEPTESALDFETKIEQIPQMKFRQNLTLDELIKLKASLTPDTSELVKGIPLENVFGLVNTVMHYVMSPLLFLNQGPLPQFELNGTSYYATAYLDMHLKLTKVISSDIGDELTNLLTPKRAPMSQEAYLQLLSRIDVIFATSLVSSVPS